MIHYMRTSKLTKKIEPAKRPVGRPPAPPTVPLHIRVRTTMRDYFIEIGGTRAFRRWLTERAAKEGKTLD